MADMEDKPLSESQIIAACRTRTISAPHFLAVKGQPMKIYCTGCQDTVDARLADGAEIYPHRKDLKSLPFWKCDNCGNYVGCHHKTADHTRPLGCIPTAEIKKARQHIHRLIDPVWKAKRISRGSLYAKMEAVLGKPYHTAEIQSVEEARDVYRAALTIVKNL